jgi:hypothetical protein
MFRRQVLFVVAAGLLLSPSVHSSPSSPVSVSVRIYNAARVAVDTRRAALAVTARTLAASQIRVDWSDCEIGDVCATPPRAGELVVRLVRARRTGTAGAPVVLGEAAIDTTAGAGVLASIYVDRVELMAKLSETDVTPLLGRAIAHEVGHLLLARNAHSARGLMRARWSPIELQRNDVLDWLLTEDDAAAIRRRLQKF